MLALMLAWSLKSLLTKFGRYLVRILGKFEQKMYNQNYTKVWTFKQNMVTYFCWQGIDVILEDVSVTETIDDAKLLILKTTIF